MSLRNVSITLPLELTLPFRGAARESGERPPRRTRKEPIYSSIRFPSCDFHRALSGVLARAAHNAYVETYTVGTYSRIVPGVAQHTLVSIGGFNGERKSGGFFRPVVFSQRFLFFPSHYPFSALSATDRQADRSFIRFYIRRFVRSRILLGPMTRESR